MSMPLALRFGLSVLVCCYVGSGACVVRGADAVCAAHGESSAVLILKVMLRYSVRGALLMPVLCASVLASPSYPQEAHNTSARTNVITADLHA